MAAVRHNPKGVIGTAVVVAAIAAAGLVMVFTPTGREASPTEVLIGFVIFTAALALAPALLGMVATAMGQSLAGHDRAGRPLLVAARPALGRLFALAVVLGLGLVAVMFVPWLPRVYAHVAGGFSDGVEMQLNQLAVGLELVLALFLGARLSLTASALVLEDASIGRSVRRSWAVTGRRPGHALGGVALFHLCLAPIVLFWFAVVQLAGMG